MRGKRIVSALLAVMMAVGTVPTLTQSVSAAGTIYKEFYVATTGSDSADGSMDAPFQTIERARQAVDEINEQMTGDIVVHIAPGNYYVTEPIRFDKEDSGMNGHEVIYQGDGGYGAARILGGRPVTGNWELATAEDPDIDPAMIGKIYKVELGDNVLDFNTLYVNGNRATMARTQNREYNARFPAGKDTYMTSAGNGDPFALVMKSGDLTQAELNAIDAALARGEEGCQVTAWDWGSGKNWFTSTIPVTGRSGNKLTFSQDSSNPAANRPKYTFGGDARYFLQGNLYFLDTEGEYHFNKRTNTLYYYPLPGEENLAEQEVIIPQVQEIFYLEGDNKNVITEASNPENQVHNITFRNFEAGATEFAGSYSSGWNAFDAYGFGSYPEEALQEGITLPSYCEQTERAEFRKGVFSLFQTNHITLDGLRIYNTGMMGLCAWGNNDYITVQNCEFGHIGHHGINIDGGYPGPECGKYSGYHLVTNNVIHDVGELAGHGTGIQAMQLHHSEFSHMEIYYSGRRAIFLEGGWAVRTEQDKQFNRVQDTATEENHLEYLYLHDLQQDGGDDGAIFLSTLYRYQDQYPGNGVNDTKPNYLNQIYLDAVGAPSSNHDYKPNCINFDMGCGGVVVTNVKGVNPQHYNFRYNEGRGEVTFENVNMAYYHPLEESNYKNFDDSRMEYDKIGVDSSFPYQDCVMKGKIPEKSYENVYFRDEFDNGLDQWWSLAGQPEVSPVYFSDNDDFMGYSFLADAFYNKSEDGRCLIGKPFGVDLNKIVEIDFFDHLNDGMENGYCGMSFQYKLNSFARVDNGSAVRAIGVNHDVSSKYYAYKIGSITKVSDVLREYGWHTFKWDYTDGENVKMYIDGQLIATAPSASFNYIEMGDYGMGGFNAYDNVVIYGGEYAEPPIDLPEPPDPEEPEEQVKALPGLIEAEDSDNRTGNTQIVDGVSGGKAVGYISVGDEYTYQVTVTEAVDLPFVASCAVMGDAGFEVYVDEEAKPRLIMDNLAKTGDWTKFREFVGDNLVLTEGEHTITLKVTANNFNLDYFALRTPEPPVTANQVDVQVNDTLILGKGSTVKIPVLVLPEDAEDKALTWSTSDDGIVAITKDNALEAVDVGTATITVQLTSDESVSETFTVEVQDVDAGLISTTEKGCVPSADVDPDHETNNPPSKLIDGDPKSTWNALGVGKPGSKADPSAFLSWDTPQTVQTIMLYDVPEGGNYVKKMEIVFFNGDEQLQTLELSDGVPDGGVKTVTLDEPLSNVTKIQFHIQDATADYKNYGFGEIKVYSGEPGVIPVNAVSFGAAGVTLFPDESYTLQVPVAVPSTATNTKLTVSVVEGEDVIRLTPYAPDGVVKYYTITALKEGKAIIRATAENGVSKDFTVVVGTKNDLGDKIIAAENLYGKYPGDTDAHKAFRKVIDLALNVYNNSEDLDDYVAAIEALDEAMKAFENAFTTAETADQVAAALQLTSPTEGQTSLTKPTLPAGFTVAIADVQPTGVIGKNWSIQVPDSDTEVTLTLLVTKIQDGTTATCERKVTVPGYSPQQVLDTVTVSSPAKGQNSLTLPKMPKGFTLTVAKSTDNFIAADGSFTLPLNETEVTVTLRVTKTSNGSYAEKDVKLTIPGIAKLLNTDIQADEIDAVNGTYIKVQNNEVVNFNGGDWIRYDYVDFGSTSKQIRFTINTAVHPNWAGKKILVKLDDPNGETLAEIVVESKGDWGIYGRQSVDFTEEISGVHTIYLVGEGGEGVGGVKEIRFDVLSEAVDKTALKSLYNANKNKPNDNYTKESWKAFQAALAEAKAVLNDENATQAQVDAAEQALSKAIDKLEKKDTSIDWPLLPSVPDEKPRWEMPFTDVPVGAWYYDSVYYAWQQELIDGVTAEQYQPDGSLTVAQAIKLASALHEMLNRGYVTLENGTANWYNTYVDYAVDNGIIEAKYQSYTKAQMDTAVTRGEFVHIFHGAMDSYKAINDVADNAIPDVKLTDAYADEIYDFYRAGILTGSDGAGTFHSKDSIKRSEVATILVRMFDDSLRENIDL